MLPYIIGELLNALKVKHSFEYEYPNRKLAVIHVQVLAKCTSQSRPNCWTLRLKLKPLEASDLYRILLATMEREASEAAGE